MDGKAHPVHSKKAEQFQFLSMPGCSGQEAIGTRLQITNVLLTGAAAQVDGEAHLVHSKEEAIGTRLQIDGLTCLLANETDPSQLLAASPGKLMRYLVADGDHVSDGQPIAEIEARPPTGGRIPGFRGQGPDARPIADVEVQPRRWGTPWRWSAGIVVCPVPAACSLHAAPPGIRCCASTEDDSCR